MVFNGSMKDSYELTAKCSIVEDGIMVQITKEALDEFKSKLNNMQVGHTVWTEIVYDVEACHFVKTFVFPSRYCVLSH